MTTIEGRVLIIGLDSSQANGGDRLTEARTFLLDRLRPYGISDVIFVAGAAGFHEVRPEALR